MPPVANDVAYATDEDTPLNVAAPGVLANDTDANGDSLTATLVVGPGNGTLTRNANGSFSYTPNSDFNGSDLFTYVANDGQADSINVATVSITVNAVNDAPVADPKDPYSGTVGVAVTFDGSGSSDVDGTTVAYAWDFGDGSLGTGVNPSHTYAAAGTYTVSLTVADDGGLSDTVTTTATIAAEPNVPPVASDFCDITPLNTNLMGDLSESVTDSDSFLLNFALINQAVQGVATIDPTGLFTYIPNPDSRGTDSFTYQVDDLQGGTANATVTVIIGDTRLMPLGDSITAGVGEPPPGQRLGYRQKLFNDLLAAGYAVDFVGGLNEPATASFDSDHEGHSGDRDDEIADAVIGYLNANPADIVLLHIGTNGFDTAALDIENILINIDTWENLNNPVTVILARIIDDVPNFLADLDVTTFNDNVAQMVALRPSDNVVLVDMESGAGLLYGNFSPGPDMNDNLHPKQSGYEKMATVWLDTLVTLLPKCP
jgi:PKD repeat protein